MHKLGLPVHNERLISNQFRKTISVIESSNVDAAAAIIVVVFVAGWSSCC